MVVEFFEFTIKTKKREEIIDITEKIEEILKKSKMGDGMCLIYVPHATAALIINENADEKVKEDILEWLRKNIPTGIWRHDVIDNNADAHIKSSLIGCSQAIPFKNNRLLLGTWQGIMLVELDGPRERKVYIVFLK